MSEALAAGRSAAVLAGLHAAVDELQGLGLDACSEDEVLGLWRGVEVARNRLAALDHALIGQASARSLRERFAAGSVPALLRDLLRVGIGEARARVAAAEAAGPRVALTGEALPPIYPEVAAAQRDGVISPAQAKTIVTTVDRLPGAVAAEFGATVEQILVERARELDTDQLARQAHDLGAALDQDGALQEVKDRERRRALRMRVRGDGSSTLAGELTAEATEWLRTVLDPLAKPNPGDGTADPRSAGQRRHDALLETCKLAARSGQLPATGGVTTSLILTMDLDDYRAAQTGQDTAGATASTGHGIPIPVTEGLQWLDGETRVISAALNSMRRIEAYGSAHRIFTENQRLVMIARDGGCVFPGCDAPPAHCETHHVIEYADGGPTTVSNGVLLCGYHHRHFQHLGWQPVQQDGRTWWRPPRWLDPDQKPRRNHRHDHTTPALN